MLNKEKSQLQKRVIKALAIVLQLSLLILMFAACGNKKGKISMTNQNTDKTTAGISQTSAAANANKTKETKETKTTEPSGTKAVGRETTASARVIRSLRRHQLTGKDIFSPIKFTVDIVQTPPMGSGVGLTDSPRILETPAELENYLQSRTGLWQFKEAKNKELCAKYDDAFFQKKVLVAGVIASNSGSTKVKLVAASPDEDHKIKLTFKLEIPDIALQNMMSWHYFAAFAKEDVEGMTFVTNLPPTGNFAEY